MKRAPSSLRRPPGYAFTLIELLVVLVIAAVLVGISIPTFLKVAQASYLTTTTTQVADQLNFARQEALSLNQDVEVRFYSLPAPNNSAINIYRAMQSFALSSMSSSSTTNAISRPIFSRPRFKWPRWRRRERRPFPSGPSWPKRGPLPIFLSPPWAQRTRTAPFDSNRTDRPRSIRRSM